MRVTIQQTIPDIGPERAQAWWSNFQPGHDDHTFIPGAHRDLEPQPDGSTRIHDTIRWLGIPIFTETVHAKQRGNTIQLTGENTFSTFQARYRFEHAFAPDGTQLTLEATIHLKGPLAWLDTLAQPLAQRILAYDTRKHLEDLANDPTTTATHPIR